MSKTDIYIDGVRGAHAQENIMNAMKIIEDARSGRGQMAKNDRVLYIDVPTKHLDQDIHTHVRWAQQQAAKGHINARVRWR